MVGSLRSSSICTIRPVVLWRAHRWYRVSFVCVRLLLTVYSVPSAASFYVPTLPDLHQDPLRPLRMYAGHLLAEDPSAVPDKTLASHLYFVLVKARRSADKERILFWFNVRCTSGRQGV